LIGCGGSPALDDDTSAASDQMMAFDELKADLETAVEEELAELEREIGDLRADAEATEEDFTAELVHLDELMEEITNRIEGARLEDVDDVETLRTETTRRLEEIRRAYTDLEERVAAASDQTEL
jgi:hypothetical protein